jgi:hypothetical protein
MDEQPIFKEKIRYLGLYLELYKFRGYYLTIVKQQLRPYEDPLVFGATIETEESIKGLKKINRSMIQGEGFNDTVFHEAYPQIEFLTGREETTGSRVENNPMETYGGYMTPLLARTNQNNRDFMNRMLEKPEIANRFLLNVTSGPLEGCVFDAEEPFLFLGDTPNKVIPNIHKIYLKMVTIRDDVSRMQDPLRDKMNMIIATALQKEQPDRLSVLPTKVMDEITEFGGKRKRKSNRMTRKRGGKKVLMDQIEFKITWRDLDRSVYTVDETRFPHISSQDILGSQSQSQSTEGSTNKVLLNEFKIDKESFDQLGKIEDGKRYIFVIVHEKEEGGQGKAVMYLDDAGNGDINHHNLSEDNDGRNNILAAGELIWDKGEKKLKISNQSGHYEPEAQDVKDVTIDFFAKSIDIDFYYPYNDGSETPLSSQSQSPIEMGMRADESYKAENEYYYKEKKGGRRKSLKKKRKSKRRKSFKKKQRKTKRKGRK